MFKRGRGKYFGVNINQLRFQDKRPSRGQIRVQLFDFEKPQCAIGDARTQKNEALILVHQLVSRVLARVRISQIKAIPVGLRRLGVGSARGPSPRYLFWESKLQTGVC